MLAYAREAGLRQAILTCDDDNYGSMAAIMANGGRLTGRDRSLYSNRFIGSSST